jgi:hypothetical protein
MRRLAVLLAIAGCGARSPIASPLPAPPPQALELSPQLAAGEQTTWDVYLQNMPIGRAALAIEATTARTTFRTTRLARALSAIRYEHASAFDRGMLRGARETLAIDGATERTELAVDGADFTERDAPGHVPGGTRLHDVHTALGVLRAWSRATPHAGYLWLWLHGELYRLDVQPPTRDDILGVAALRVDGTARTPHRSSPIPISLWLARNADRTPLRLALSVDGNRVTAEVVESTASLDAR